MSHRSRIQLALLACTAAAWLGSAGSALSQPGMPATQAAADATQHHEIPVAIQREHDEAFRRLAILARREGPLGVAARKAQVVLKRHVAREVEYILPPLTLLPDLANGKVTPDMAWAMAMSDRVRADRAVISQDRADTVDAYNAIIAAAMSLQDPEAAHFAYDASRNLLFDLQIEEPTVLLIGEYLHSKLDANHN